VGSVKKEYMDRVKVLEDEMEKLEGRQAGETGGIPTTDDVEDEDGRTIGWALRVCPECGWRPIFGEPPEDEKCPQCGARLTTKSASKQMNAFLGNSEIFALGNAEYALEKGELEEARKEWGDASDSLLEAKKIFEERLTQEERDIVGTYLKKQKRRLSAIRDMLYLKEFMVKFLSKKGDPEGWDESDELVLEGLEALKKGEYDNALKHFDKAVKKNEKNADAWYWRGKTYCKLESYNAALMCFNFVIDVDPNYADAWMGKGDALYKLREFDESNECYAKVIEIKRKEREEESAPKKVRRKEVRSKETRVRKGKHQKIKKSPKKGRKTRKKPPSRIQKRVSAIINRSGTCFLSPGKGVGVGWISEATKNIKREGQIHESEERIFKELWLHELSFKLGDALIFTHYPMRKAGRFSRRKKVALSELLAKGGSGEEAYLVTCKLEGRDLRNRPTPSCYFIICSKEDHDALLYWASTEAKAGGAQFTANELIQAIIDAAKLDERTVLDPTSEFHILVYPGDDIDKSLSLEEKKKRPQHESMRYHRYKKE